MKNNKLKVIETYHHDGDQTYYWSSIEEALESGRFDYLYDNFDDDDYEDFNDLIIKSENLADFIEKVSYPFFIEK